MLPNIAVVADANGAELGELSGPLERWVPKTIVHDKELASLFQGVSTLNQRARGVTGLDNNGSLGKSGHRDVPFREEMFLSLKILISVSNDRDLADYQVMVGDPLL